MRDNAPRPAPSLLHSPADVPADLIEVIAAWPRLSEATRRRIIGLIRGEG